MVSYNPNTSEDTLFYIASNTTEPFIGSKGIDRIKDPDKLSELAKSTNPSVRYNVWKNKNTPNDIELALAQDPLIQKALEEEEKLFKKVNVKVPGLEEEKQQPKSETTNYIKTLRPKELKALAENPKTPDDVLLNIISGTDDFFTRNSAVSNIKSIENLDKITDKDLTFYVDKRRAELSIAPTQETPTETPTETSKEIPAETPVKTPVIEEQKEEAPIEEELLPKRSKEEKQKIDDSLLFIILPDDFTGDKGKLQRAAKGLYQDEYPKLKQVVTYPLKKIKETLDKYPQYKNKAIAVVPYEEIMKKLEPKKRSHDGFYNEIKKIAQLDDPYLMAVAMIQYSSEIENSDPELSIQLLTRASEILDA